VIGVDTNVLVRYVTQDDPIHSALANRVLAQFSADFPMFVSLVALVEAVWVLRRSYRIDEVTVTNFVDSLLAAPEVVVQAPDVVRRALTLSREHTTSFSDAVIAMLGIDADCDETLTFDKRASELPGMRLLV
jgi:predicted nucleic-acid-binding protein